MTILQIVFASIGLLTALAGVIMLWIAAFRTSVVWGLVTVFGFELGRIVFAITHWEVAGRGFLLYIFGLFIAAGAVFSSPKTRADVAKGAKEVKLPMVEREKPRDLNVLIDVKRAEIDKMEAQFREHGAVVSQQYQSLNARRAELKQDDPVAVEAFNGAAAAYQQSNSALKQLRQQIDAAQIELTNLLDERSRQKAGGKPGGAAVHPVFIDLSPAASRSAPAVVWSASGPFVS